MKGKEIRRYLLASLLLNLLPIQYRNKIILV